MKKIKDERVKREVVALQERSHKDAVEIDRLRGALAPFAKFVFGPKYGGHALAAREGDCVVLCGYDDKGYVTGVDVKMSDFAKAKDLMGVKP